MSGKKGCVQRWGSLRVQGKGSITTQQPSSEKCTNHHILATCFFYKKTIILPEAQFS